MCRKRRVGGEVVCGVGKGGNGGEEESWKGMNEKKHGIVTLSSRK